MEILSFKLDVIAARGLVLQLLQILGGGYSSAPVHMDVYTRMAEAIETLAHFDADKTESTEIRALQSILFGLGRGEPGHYKTWTGITIERLRAMGNGQAPEPVELAEVKHYLEVFKKFLAELSKAL